MREWKKFSPHLKERQQIVRTFFDFCDTGAHCETEAWRIARNYLVLFDLSDNDAQIAYQLKIANDGAVDLLTQRLRFVHYVESHIPAAEVKAIGQRLGAAPPAADRGDGDQEWPRRGKDVQVVVPAFGQLPEVRGRLEKVPAATVLTPLIDDLAITDRASSIRLEAVPAHNMEGHVEVWPAEDLLPIRVLEKRKLTPKEWRSVAARLAYHDRKGYADFRFLDGKPFGYPGPVYLHVIASSP